METADAKNGRLGGEVEGDVTCIRVRELAAEALKESCCQLA